ncbi:TSUP family transporter [Piscinibacter terrae]|uniref:Probable membrane transporter protein n=1 Tax=Piscinibacter terrae TaxID=2496871 RepID=A0A3N7HIU4_9BURK|nr:TSUP family transporter [Albitalea terrae]RQP21954.1 hypothetical protein DZC73_26360 [Albitalea terrae]
MDHSYAIGLVVLGLAVVQSLFGMGILVFGTPTLLLLGIEFSSVLGWLLPSSLAISALQVWGDRRKAAQTPSHLVIRYWSVAVPLLAALSFMLLSHMKASVELWVGLAMLTAAVLRGSDLIRQWLRGFILRHERAYLVLMGAFHGFTNMGGAALAIYSSSVTDNKHAMRALISRYYLLFGSIQIVALVLLQPASLRALGLALAPLSALIYVFLGSWAFERLKASIYERAFTGFIAAYGLALLGKNYLR